MRYEEMQFGGYIEELARCFNTPMSVRALLLDASVALQNVSAFADAPARDYWQTVCHQIALGAAADGLVRVLAAAARRLPGNAVFSAFHPDHTAGSPAALRVLFLGGALPAGSPPARIDLEFQAIQDQLRHGTLRQPAEVVSRFGVAAENLIGAVLSAAPSLIHYAGHGRPDGSLVVDAPARKIDVLTAETVGKVLRTTDPRIRCVVLNACYSDEAAKVLLADTDIVVGTTAMIGDSAAVAFAQGFYVGIAHRMSVGVATGLGRVQMELQKQPGAEHISLRARAGVDPSKVFLA